MWSKIKDLIRSTNNNSDEYNENYIQVKFNSDDNSPLGKNAKIAWHNISC